MLRKIILVAAWLMPFFLFSQEKIKNWSVGGYIKDLQSVMLIDVPGFGEQLLSDNLIHNRLNFDWYPHDRWTVKASLRNRFFWGDQVRLAGDTYIDLLDNSNDYLTMSIGVADEKGLAAHALIDRLNVQYSKGNFEARIGRQRINWGINTFWNPNDIFNASNFADFDYEEMPGADALLLRQYFKNNSSFDMAIRLFDSWDEAVFAGLWKTNVKTYDLQFLVGKVEHDIILGTGWAGNVQNAGFKGEASWFVPFDTTKSEAAFSATVSMDYGFKKGLYLGGGLLYNSLANREGNLATIFSFELTAKNLYPTQLATFVTASYSFNQRLSGSGTVVYTPSQLHPMFLTPSLSYSISENWDLNVVGQLAFSEQAGQYRNLISAGFLRMKWSM